MRRETQIPAGSCDCAWGVAVDEVSGDLKVTLREVGNEVSRRRETRVLYQLEGVLLLACSRERQLVGVHNQGM